MTLWVGRAWVRLNRPPRASGPGPAETRTAQSLRTGIIAAMGMAAPCVGLLVAAVLVVVGRQRGLGALAVSEAGLLVTGTVAAWILLSHARSDDAGASDAM